LSNNGWPLAHDLMDADRPLALSEKS
jgi:hypothetical protein